MRFFSGKPAAPARKKLILCSYGSLADRILTAMYGIPLAQKYDRDFELYWPPNTRYRSSTVVFGNKFNILEADSGVWRRGDPEEMAASDADVVKVFGEFRGSPDGFTRYFRPSNKVKRGVEQFFLHNSVSKGIFVHESLKGFEIDENVVVVTDNTRIVAPKVYYITNFLESGIGLWILRSLPVVMGEPCEFTALASSNKCDIIPA